jgi:proteasome accessory factor B
MAAPRRTPASTQKPTEARLIGLASFILERGGSASREDIYEAFPDDYRGSALAREKKFSRDKDALHRLGFAVETEQLARDRSVYSIDPQACVLPPIELSPEEAALLWTAGTAALRLSLHPLRDELESALRKLVVGACGLPPRASAPEDLSAVVSPAVGETLERLIDAWERRRRVRLRYWRVASGEEVERDVDVYGWASRRGEWIFVGYCHLREAERVFYVSRVREVTTPRGAKDADYEVPARFDIRRWSRQQIWDYEVHGPKPAAIAFRGALARIAQQLLPGARVETDETGARIARIEVRNVRGLVHQALAWGPDAELLEPAEGRAMAREILDAMLAGGRP